MIEKAKNVLATGVYTCVVCGEAVTMTAVERGVKPLVAWLQSGTDLRDCCAADKVVGKATAFLYCLLGVRAVYGRVMSVPALAVLQAGGIEAQYEMLVPHIINRAGDGICPFEKAVENISDPQMARRIILQKMQRNGT